MDKAQPIWLSRCLKKVVSEPKRHPNENQARMGLNLSDYHDFKPKLWGANTYAKQCM